MSELIERQAAIDAAKDWYEGLICGSVNGLIKRLNALPTIQPEPQLIPVSERLPEESGYYIVTAHDGTSYRTTFVKYQKKYKSWDFTGARSYWRVIAWMPLPEPYKPNK